jgi:RNA polymerase sigma-70 factor (ECF subfamily)
MERISLRDSAALSMLYGRYGREAFALAYTIAGKASGAEEIVQDAFETVWNSGTRFDFFQGANVRGWLMAIVHHRAIDFRRRELDRPPRSLHIESMDYVLSTPDVWNDVSATLLGEEVRVALNSLPGEQRRTIEMAFFDGLSHGEIASQENEPLGTVKGRLRSGLRKLSGAVATSLDAAGPYGEERG